MFSNLPGATIRVKPGTQTCTWYNDEVWETLTKMKEKGIASDLVLELIEAGEDFGCTCPAVHRVQGETDSFGAEYEYYCDKHLDTWNELSKFWANETAEEPHHCDWCKAEVPGKDIRTTRDIDEGSNGPVYEVCSSCYEKQQKEIETELYGEE